MRNRDLKYAQNWSGGGTHARISTARARKSAKKGARFLVAASCRVVAVVAVVVVAMAAEGSGARAKFKVIRPNEASRFLTLFPP